MRTIIPYNPKLKAYARQLRRNMTVAEVLLWKKLKGRQVDGYDFDRQHPIGEYIVDFYCKDLRLAIEVDGISHDYRKEDDARRQQQIEKSGVRFLRFWEQEVKTDRGSVVERIREWIGKQGTHPQPLQGGEVDGENPPPPLRGGELDGSNPPPAPPGRGGGWGEPTPGPSGEGRWMGSNPHLALRGGELGKEPTPGPSREGSWMGSNPPPLQGGEQEK